MEITDCQPLNQSITFYACKTTHINTFNQSPINRLKALDWLNQSPQSLFATGNLLYLVIRESCYIGNVTQGCSGVKQLQNRLFIRYRFRSRYFFDRYLRNNFCCFMLSAQVNKCSIMRKIRDNFTSNNKTTPIVPHTYSVVGKSHHQQRGANQANYHNSSSNLANKGKVGPEGCKKKCS